MALLKTAPNIGSADALVRKRVRSTRKFQETWNSDCFSRFALIAGEGARAPSIWLQPDLAIFFGKANHGVSPEFDPAGKSDNLTR